MDLKALKSKIKNEKTKFFDVDGYSFELTIVNDVELMKFAMQSRREENFSIEIALILASVTDYKNIKVRDIINDYGTEEEGDEVVPFDKELLKEFLGKNQEIIVKLFEEVGVRMEAYKKKAVKTN